MLGRRGNTFNLRTTDELSFDRLVPKLASHHSCSIKSVSKDNNFSSSRGGSFSWVDVIDDGGFEEIHHWHVVCVLLVVESHIHSRHFVLSIVQWHWTGDVSRINNGCTSFQIELDSIREVLE